ncbi:histidine phosphatase superfamily [Triangularia verruculosa]|uniref:3-phytase n=1 Tax=Triangularia verruculosa TaxID=2587418 RepID=A0AAN6XLS9_9PEZI|nr:histidine phosphatase superfamily [Triangularia verruculosa]
MSSLKPRAPYTDAELQKLYPANLDLQLVQILMRHGERTPITARFPNTGLPAFWPYCSSVRQITSTILSPIAQNSSSTSEPHLDTLQWKRRLETFASQDDSPTLALSPTGLPDNICDMGTLTDLGRQTTYTLGLRLRDLYVSRLKFLPDSISSTDNFYLRTTPVPRALESLQQTFSALYPPNTRQPSPETGLFPTPAIVSRAHADETLYPNDGNCRRFAALSRAFAQRAADKWNDTSDMEFLNSLYGKWMGGQKVAVDSRPRLSGIMDTINATYAHGPQTKLPKEFYDEKAKGIIEKIGVEEWFQGYRESREYRTLGIGGLMGDLTQRMVGAVEGRDGQVKLGLHGCHDTTLAGVLASVGAFETHQWPPFTSHIAVELFKEGKTSGGNSQGAGWWSSLFGGEAKEIGRRLTEELSEGEKKKMEGYYVRLRYNDEVVTVPGCKKAGNHLEGDESFCTLAAFKEIVDKFTPKNWKQECRLSRGETVVVPKEPEWAGY